MTIFRMGMVKLGHLNRTPRRCWSHPWADTGRLVPVCTSEYPIPGDSRKFDAEIEEWRPVVYNQSGGERYKPQRRRNTIKKAHKQEILDLQENHCLYCQLEFGTVVYQKTKARVLRIHWDHFVPYAYLQAHPRHNFVAACQICNGIKSSLMLDTIEQARSYIAGEWKRKKLSLTPMGLPYDLEDEEYESWGKIKEFKGDSHRPEWHAYVYAGKRRR